jgi:hypothetical protein
LLIVDDQWFGHVALHFEATSVIGSERSCGAATGVRASAAGHSIASVAAAIRNFTGLGFMQLFENRFINAP